MFKRMKEDGIRPGKVFFNEGSVPKKKLASGNKECCSSALNI